MHPVSSFAVAHLRTEELRREVERASPPFGGGVQGGPERKLRLAETSRRAVAWLGLWLLRLAGTKVVVIRIGGPRACRARVARS